MQGKTFAIHVGCRCVDCSLPSQVLTLSFSPLMPLFLVCLGFVYRDLDHVYRRSCQYLVVPHVILAILLLLCQCLFRI